MQAEVLSFQTVYLVRRYLNFIEDEKELGYIIKAGISKHFLNYTELKNILTYICCVQAKVRGVILERYAVIVMNLEFAKCAKIWADFEGGS